MAKPIATPIAFAPLAPPWSLVSLDSNFTSSLNAFNDYSTYSNYLADTSGSANTITVNTPAGTAFAYSAGIQVQVKVAITNTSGTVNLNVNSLGNQLVKNPDGSNPVVGGIVGAGIYTFQYDGTNFQVLGSATGVTGFANPTGTVGLVAVNGSATTAPRSDSAPALSQAIVPTWTGLHKFTGDTINPSTATTAVLLGAQSGTTPMFTYINSAGAVDGKIWRTNVASAVWTLDVTNDAYNVSRAALTVTRSANAIASMAYGNTTDNPSHTLRGNTTAVAATSLVLILNNSAGGDSLLKWQYSTIDKALVGISSASGNLITGSVAGDFGIRNMTGAAFLVSTDNGSSVGLKVTNSNGAVQFKGPTAAALVDMTPDTGTFTGTLTGFTVNPTGTVNWIRMGNVACVYITSSITGTSNATTMTMTGLPAAIQPANSTSVMCYPFENNSGSTTLTGVATISGGTITFLLTTGGASAAFTNVNVKGVIAGWMITYPLA